MTNHCSSDISFTFLAAHNFFETATYIILNIKQERSEKKRGAKLKIAQKAAGARFCYLPQQSHARFIAQYVFLLIYVDKL